MSKNKDAFATISEGILTICTYTEFAPFSYEDGGDIAGTDISLLREFAEEMDLGLEIIKRGFAGLWETPGNGDCDVSAAGMMEYEDRYLGETAVWSDPYMLVTRSLLIRRSDLEILKGPEDFEGKKIVVTPSSSAHIDGDLNEYLAGEYFDEHGERLLALTDVHSMENPELLRFAVRSVDERLPATLNEFIRKIQRF